MGRRARRRCPLTESQLDPRSKNDVMPPPASIVSAPFASTVIPVTSCRLARAVDLRRDADAFAQRRQFAFMQQRTISPHRLPRAARIEQVERIGVEHRRQPSVRGPPRAAWTGSLSTSRSSPGPTIGRRSVRRNGLGEITLLDHQFGGGVGMGMFAQQLHSPAPARIAASDDSSGAPGIAPATIASRPRRYLWASAARSGRNAAAGNARRLRPGSRSRSETNRAHRRKRGHQHRACFQRPERRVRSSASRRSEHVAVALELVAFGRCAARYAI